MNISSVLAGKKENSIKLKKALGLLLKYKPLGLIKLDNNELSNSLIEGLVKLPIGVVIYTKNAETNVISDNLVITGNIDDTDLSGFDFIVCDNEISELYKYIEKGITPIIVEDNHMSAILKEFDPLKNEGNAFFYKELDKWSIYYTIVRYLENYKFPYDNKNLVKNILKV